MAQDLDGVAYDEKLCGTAWERVMVGSWSRREYVLDLGDRKKRPKTKKERAEDKRIEKWITHWRKAKKAKTELLAETRFYLEASEDSLELKS